MYFHGSEQRASEKKINRKKKIVRNQSIWKIEMEFGTKIKSSFVSLLIAIAFCSQRVYQVQYCALEYCLSQTGIKTLGYRHLQSMFYSTKKLY